MTTWKELKKEMLSDPEVKKAYDDLAPEFEIASALIQARIDQKLTQAQVAEKAGVSQVMVARLESGDSNPTMSTVRKVAHALGRKVAVV